MKTKIIIGLILMISIFAGCRMKNDTVDIILNGSIIKCYGLYFSGEIDEFNLTEREMKYYLLGTISDSFPLNISFEGSCDIDNDIPDKIYDTFTDVPLDDDCYNKNRCYIKWNITN